MNISEIAKLAGVSNAAVSRYLNHGYLSEEKREAVRKVIEETGYRPSVQAQVLRTRKTNTVGVILPRINSFSVSSVLAGIDAVLEEKGFQILLADTHNNPNKELEYLEIFNHQHVDGVILIATVFTAKHLSVIKKRTIPVVIVGQQLLGVPCVYHDDYHAFYEITELVLQKGCRKLGYIGALAQDKAVGQERRRAYRDAVRDAGLPEQAEHTAVADFTIPSGGEKARELLDACGPLDALVCTTDMIAVGALQYLKSRGIQVPRQMMLTGHGAADISSVTAPTITTIHYFYEESGMEAAKLLLEQLEKPDMPAKEVKLGYAIVENESTARG
ncbi:MAG: LacI family DNA-binding transcriptional regulator [Oscillospiraceae bacterium]|nr:LacI family DNA-binding transcriptional regulator [Oscillospiraceae bacterium]